MSFVLDSSVALSWCFEDERIDATESLLERTVASPVRWLRACGLLKYRTVWPWPSEGVASILRVASG